MNASALALIGLAYFVSPLSLEQGVFETNTREFHIPVALQPDVRDTVSSIRLLVSHDRGKTWKLHEGIPSDGTRFTFKAATDGELWFASQLEKKDGKLEPAKLESQDVSLKVYVNAAGRPVARATAAGYQPPQLPPPPAVPTDLQSLQREVQELRATIERLQKRLEKLEKQRTPN